MNSAKKRYVIDAVIATGTGLLVLQAAQASVMDSVKKWQGQLHDEWQIIASAVILLILLIGIFKIVRRSIRNDREFRRKQRALMARPNNSKFGLNTTGHFPGNTTINPWDETNHDNTPRERNSTLLRNTMSGDPYLDTAPPISIIQTDWKDIQSKIPNPKTSLNVEVIEIDTEIKNSVQRSGYNPFYQPLRSSIDENEISKAMTEVELYCSLGYNDQAIELLERLIAEIETPRPKIWLVLFELYAKTGQQAKFEKLGEGFKNYFNANAPVWQDATGEGAKQLEDYASVIHKVVRLWGMPSCKTFLESLLYDNRSGTRHGFSLSAYDDIIFLLDVLPLLHTAQQLDLA